MYRMGARAKDKQLPPLKPSDSGGFVKKDEYLIRNGARLFQEKIVCVHGKINPIRMFSVKELRWATKDFCSEWSMPFSVPFSSVYEGIIEDRRVIVKAYADKMFHLFLNEVVSLSLIKHKNVVNLLGCCIETENPILVLEFPPRGILLQNTSCKERPLLKLLWPDKLRIMMELADALAYMHVAHQVPIIYGFLASRCILLDESCSAKLFAFEFSKIQKQSESSDAKSDFVKKHAKSADVHLFGITLAELITENQFIPYQLITKEEIFRSLKTDECEKYMVQMEACSDLAARCTSWDMDEKPSIKEIVRELQHITGFSIGLQRN